MRARDQVKSGIYFLSVTKLMRNLLKRMPIADNQA
jgi:hypothetical protein